MAERVYVHIGAPKSGTTFLQTVLWANQEPLKQAGVLVPGSRKFDHNEVAGWTRSDRPKPGLERTWRRLATEIRRWPGTVVLSNEWFTMATEQQAGRFVRALEPAEVHVIFTARNLSSTVPAAWQETLKLGRSTGLAEFIDELETPSDPRWCWGTLDPAVVLPRWSAWISPSHVHVVTVPPRSAGPDLLWHRFAATCGVDPAVCDTDQGRTNESIGAESARLLQLLGPELRAAISVEHAGWYRPYRWIRDYFSHTLLVPQGGSKIALAPDELALLMERSQHVVGALTAGGYDIVGDLQELATGAIPPGAVRPECVSDEALLELTEKLVPPLLRRVSLESDRVRRESELARRESDRARALEVEVADVREELAHVREELNLARRRQRPAAPPAARTARRVVRGLRRRLGRR